MILSSLQFNLIFIHWFEDTYLFITLNNAFAKVRLYTFTVASSFTVGVNLINTQFSQILK